MKRTHPTDADIGWLHHIPTKWLCILKKFISVVVQQLAPQVMTASQVGLPTRNKTVFGITSKTIYSTQYLELPKRMEDIRKPTDHPTLLARALPIYDQ